MTNKLKYRLGLDIGAKSIGWAMIRLNNEGEPVALIKTGVRIFSDGRDPVKGASLAVVRREKRQARKRRDRLLKRKNRIMQALIEFGFFPTDTSKRKQLELLDPYELRAKGLDQQLSPAEFARALFHINQRRGFKSNRKTDTADNDSGLLKKAISKVREQIESDGKRTIGEWLASRHKNRESVRARLRGKTVKDKAYDLYIDRKMIEDEFDLLWMKQSTFNPVLFNEIARNKLKGELLHQRPLKPVKPGRCTLIPEEERAPLALPSVQKFRIYQEVNNLRLIDKSMNERSLQLAERDLLVAELDRKEKLTFTQITKLLKLASDITFNLDDGKRDALKGNSSSVRLSKADAWGNDWFSLSTEQQDGIVSKILHEESESDLVDWLHQEYSLDEARAEFIARKIRLADGYGSLSSLAIDRVLPKLIASVITYDAAVKAAGFASHSELSHFKLTGEIANQLPYYAEVLQRHVAFGTGELKDNLEKRLGKIANPTVHIGLNELRKVVNALIKKYGNPTEVIVEVARDLKNGYEAKKEIQEQQAKNQKRNEAFREQIRPIIQREPTVLDIQKMILWTELNPDIANRSCPYTGEKINIAKLFSDEVEIEHILPFSRTLDDSLNNKTVSIRKANRLKANKTPFEAFGHSPEGFDYTQILERANLMSIYKRKRFAPDAYEKWLQDDKDFLARALNDTAYLSRIAREYLSVICPENKVRVIPGRLTALLRGKFKLNELLSGSSEKNRNDHRHHALDAIVIAITDQSMLQKFSIANKQAREKGLAHLVEKMPLPWTGFHQQVAQSLAAIKVSFRPDHGYQGEIFDSTVYGLRPDGSVTYRQEVDGVFTRPSLNRDVVKFADASPTKSTGALRHGIDDTDSPKSYMGLWSRSNYCIDIISNEAGDWSAEVVPRYVAYKIVNNKIENESQLKSNASLLTNQPVVFRLMIDDVISIQDGNTKKLLRVTKISAANGKGGITCTELHESNTSNRYLEKLKAKKLQKENKPFDTHALNDEFLLTQLSPGALKNAKAKKATISPIGIVTYYQRKE